MNEYEISQMVVDSALEVQMLTYLRLTGLDPGLVINFGEQSLARKPLKANGLSANRHLTQRRQGGKARRLGIEI